MTARFLRSHAFIPCQAYLHHRRRYPTLVISHANSLQLAAPEHNNNHWQAIENIHNIHILSQYQHQSWQPSKVPAKLVLMTVHAHILPTLLPPTNPSRRLQPPHRHNPRPLERSNNFRSPLRNSQIPQSRRRPRPKHRHSIRPRVVRASLRRPTNVDSIILTIHSLGLRSHRFRYRSPRRQHNRLDISAEKEGGGEE